MRSSKVLPSAGVVCLFIFLFSSVALAQQPTGSVVGNAYDPSGATIAGAGVTLRNIGTGESKAATTNPEGYYEFALLRPSTYEVLAEAKGFRRLHLADIVVNVGSVVRADLRFEIGQELMTVEVPGSAIPLIEPDRTSIKRALDLNAIMFLPMEGRRILDLARTAPGAIPGAPGTQVVGFSVAGMRTQSNNYTLDGISNNDPQVNGPLNAFRLTDAIQEFNVQTSIASTDVGRNSGAQVNIVTKSGTNDFHGSAFYYGRNDALDANDFFLNRAGEPRNVLRRHQYGGTAGGRLIRDKTFWFFSFEGWREKVQEPLTARVPTAVERANVTDPVSLRVLELIPEANTPFGTAAGLPPGVGSNWTGTTIFTEDNETYLWKIDQNLTRNHSFTGRYAWFRGSTNDLQSISFPFHGNITNAPGQHNMVLQENWATSRIVNQARLGFSRNRTFFRPEDVGLNPASIFTDAGGNPLPGYVDTSIDALNGGLPNITITGLAGLGAGTNMPQGRATNTVEAFDDVSIVAPWGFSRHTLRFGGSFRHEQANRFLNGNYRGQVSFQCFNTVDLRSQDPNAQIPCTRSFASGRPQRGSLRTGEGGTFRTWTRNVWTYYIQDIFKARSNWTINYGVRWEYFGQAVERLDRGSNFMPGVGMMVLGTNLRIDVDPAALGRNALILTPVDGAFMPRSGQRGGDYNNYAPFLGISWQPKILPRLFGQGKTVIRTGFRVSYDDIFANIPVNQGLNLPLVLSTTLPTATYAWGTVLNQNRRLFASDGTVPGGERGIITFNSWDFDAPTAYAMNYALEIERQLGNDYSIAISYVGSQGRKLGAFLDGNQPTITGVLDPTRRGDQTPNQRAFPFPQYAGIFQGAFVSNSTYNGLVAVFRKRLRHGMTYTASYTFGRSLDDNSSFFGSTGEPGFYADSLNRAAERGRSAFDVTHRVSATMVYQLPFGPGRKWLGGVHPVLGHVVGGWDMSSIFSYRSGFPFTITAGTSFDYSGLNQFGERPNWAPGISGLSLDYNEPANVFSCRSGAGNCPTFTQPIPDTIGNVGRNLFEGPTSTVVDFGIMKNFPIRERLRFQVRAELFNAFNKTNFNLPSRNIQFSGGVVTSSTVGTIQTAQDPRLIQLALRVDW